MSIEGQSHFFTIYFPGFVCFVLYYAKILGERLQDHWSSGFLNILRTYRQNETKFCTHIIMDKIYVGIVNNCFSQFCNRAMALD